MSNDGREPAGEGGSTGRRVVLGGLAAAVATLLGFGTLRQFLDDGPGRPEVEPRSTSRPSPDRSTAVPVEPDEWLAAVNRFAPDLYFGARERWFPTDPRPYVTERDGRRVVDGPAALASYTRDVRAAGEPPRPTVFYHVVPVGDDVVTLQYWLYSVFDQFAVNFHWHDWELLQVFLDRETEAPILLSASAHARSCPNNEYLLSDPDGVGRPAVLAEVGSHSSATDVNPSRPSFERLSADVLGADVSNGFVRPLDRLLDQPFAYGLPRDEGLGVPYSLPELDGVPLHQHPSLSDLALDDFVDADVTVRSWRDLARPPAGLPRREPGRAFVAPESPTDGDTRYELRPLDAAAAAIDDFTGPQLSFEFAIPGFVEDRFASHITTAGIPWEDPRSVDPAGDITDPAHRRAITGDAPAGLGDRVTGVVRMLRSGAGGTLPGVEEADRDALEPFVTVSLFPPPVEVACRLESDPAAVATAGGVFRFLHVGPGRHDLLVNGPGMAPFATRFSHGGGTVRPGAAGRMVLVANEEAAVLRGDRRGTTGVSRVRVVETYAGPVYDSLALEAGRFAVPVHRRGRYRIEVVDDDGRLGVVHVDPAGEDVVTVPAVETGKAALARSLASVLDEAAGVARQSEPARGVIAAFDAALQDARLAADLAAEGDEAGANEALVAVLDDLATVKAELEAAATQANESDLAWLRHRARRAEALAIDTYNTGLAG